MKKPTKLSSVFHDCAPGRVDVPEDDCKLEEELERALEVGRRQWSELPLPPEDFVRYLARRLPPDNPEVSLEQLLAGMHLGDLYLACACAHDLPKAIPTLEHHVLAKLRESLKQP